LAPREGLEPPTSSSGAIRQEALNAFGFWSLESHVAIALIVIPVRQYLESGLRCVLDGAPRGTRTPDPLLRRHAICLLSSSGPKSDLTSAHLGIPGRVP